MKLKESVKWKLSATILIVLTGAALLTSCKKENKEVSLDRYLVGKWKTTETKFVVGQDTSVNDMSYNLEPWSMEFKKNGTIVFPEELVSPEEAAVIKASYEEVNDSTFNFIIKAFGETQSEFKTVRKSDNDHMTCISYSESWTTITKRKRIK